MTAFGDVLIDLLGELSPTLRRDEEATGVLVVGVDLDVPLETRISSRGLEATVPRGRLATGFDVPLGRLRAVVAWSGDES